jgi:hypothetical protein
MLPGTCVVAGFSIMETDAISTVRTMKGLIPLFSFDDDCH